MTQKVCKFNRRKQRKRSFQSLTFSFASPLLPLLASVQKISWPNSYELIRPLLLLPAISVACIATAVGDYVRHRNYLKAASGRRTPKMLRISSRYRAEGSFGVR